MYRLKLAVLAMMVATVPLVAQQLNKKALDHDVYDSWKSVGGTDLSRNGQWLTFSISPVVGDGELFIRRTANDQVIKQARGSGARFTSDSKYVVATIVPAKADVDQAKKEKKPVQDQPKNQMGILNLETGQWTYFDKVRSWRMPSKDIGWLAYQIETATAPAAGAGAPGTGGARPGGGRPGGGGRPTPPAGPDHASDDVQTATPQVAPAQATPGTPQKPEETKQPEAPKKKAGHAVGQEWILRRVSDNKEIKLADTVDVVWNENGDAVIYTVSTKTGEGDGVFMLDLKTEKTTTIAKGLGQYRNVTLHDKTGTVAFLTDRDRYTKDPAEWALHTWKQGESASKEVVTDATAGLGSSYVLVNRGGISFSNSGARIFFATGPKPETPKPDPTPDEEKPVVDVWAWTDKVLMPQQILQANAERNRSYRAMLDVATGRVIQLEDPKLTSVAVGGRSDGRYGIGSNDDEYREIESWTQGFNDIWIVDLKDGSRKQVFRKFPWNPSMTLDGNFLYWFDGETENFHSMEISTGKVHDISSAAKVTFRDLDQDVPGRTSPGGFPTPTDDGRLVVSDSFDLWVLDPSGAKAPWCLTDGVGRFRNWSFRLQNFPRQDDVPGIDTSGTLMLGVTDLHSQATGFFKDSFDPKTRPEKLVMGDYRLTVSTKAEDSNQLAVTRMTFREYPDVWLTDTSFSNMKKVSDANPQQNQYIWGNAEKVSWLSADGVPLNGVLIKPENFDPAKKYPMIVYFYELSFDTLHQHRVPSPSASTINPTMFASNGYLVFMPDIRYRIGYPGEGAEHAVISGTLEVVRRGYVDPKRIGIQGQSWGGYQVMHLITRTRLFAAAGAGAAVSNMTSAYGGIREGSGLVRQFQYEVGQSRIGGSIWDYPLRYLENSPIFAADKVTTPVLMMNNDRDDAVPFSQGVEMFTALRRLRKQVWMLNYNGDLHNLSKRPNRKDLSIRLHQFFDHYLKGEPMPKWMAEGVPAVNKGKDLGYELVKPKP